ncbi:peptidoglycan DD-metalloendopeptidase family protein [Agaribacter flavus]|uniref:Peptidoglycan DD-metalloendopeptidase family protein n=1 Tax=Agaribacter flavus TaxID=1902781 RepID=A0ABV7FV56_9ALTE
MYTVKPGDTLFSIAFYSGNAYRDLAKWNNIAPPYSIYPNQLIRLRSSNKKVKIKEKLHSISADNQELVDVPAPQAYRGREEKHRKIQFDRSGSSTKSYKDEKWTWPAIGTNKVATVGIEGSNRGIDIKGKAGSSILAAASGKVVYAGNALKGYGNLIVIKHDDEYLSAYAHNDKILVTEQSFVKQGEKIATMGSTGSSETMLHFEIRKMGRSIDPLNYLP